MMKNKNNELKKSLCKTEYHEVQQNKLSEVRTRMDQWICPTGQYGSFLPMITSQTEALKLDHLHSDITLHETKDKTNQCVHSAFYQYVSHQRHHRWKVLKSRASEFSSQQANKTNPSSLE